MEALTMHFFGYTVEARRESHHVDFTVYEVAAFEIQPEGDVAVYLRDDGEVGADYVYDTTDSAVEMRGFVKWDGCSNWFVGDRELMIHGCTRSDLERVGAILTACWDWAAELMPEHAYMFE